MTFARSPSTTAFGRLRARHGILARKVALELGPAACFFIVTWRYNVNAATAAMMLAIVASLGLSYWLTRRLPIMPAATAASVLIFGTLTLYFNDPIFIKIKPTVVNCLLAATFLGRLALGKPLLPAMFDNTLNLDETGWRILGVRWACFFLVMALANEVVWRTQSDIVWAGFRTFVTTPLALGFTALQLPVMRKHRLKPEAAMAEPRGLQGLSCPDVLPGTEADVVQCSTDTHRARHEGVRLAE